LQRVLVLIVGQNQDYKNAKVALCNSYSKTHCEGNNLFYGPLAIALKRRGIERASPFHF
jgi:hypothetical protein